jgi:alpha-beta hydrolase superfamily lysophospholipase
MGWKAKEEKLDGGRERCFELSVENRRVPGVYWSPKKDSERLVLLGHGGTTHKKADYMLGIAKMFVNKGFSVMAIDGPGHGDRDEVGLSEKPEKFEEAWISGGGTDGVVADWSAALDFIEEEEGVRPTGWWGLSMGTMMGLPVVANDTRIKVALLGLMGNWGPDADLLVKLAPKVTCPVRFLVQWDDEVVPRNACLDLFDKLGSKKKTLHANPGLHSSIPQFEVVASVDYLDRFVA